MTAGDVELLLTGGLRAKRQYGEYRASECGRALVRQGDGEDLVVVMTPNKIVVTNDKSAYDELRGRGLVCHFVETWERAIMIEEIEEAPSIGLRRALRWVVGR